MSHKYSPLFIMDASLRCKMESEVQDVVERVVDDRTNHYEEQFFRIYSEMSRLEGRIYELEDSFTYGFFFASALIAGGFGMWRRFR